MEHYASWEWQPIELIPDGCTMVAVRDDDGNVKKCVRVITGG